MELLTWHQQKAIQRTHSLRHHSAHILSANYIQTGKALCGLVDPRVWIPRDAMRNPGNLCCQRCLAVAERQSQP